MSSWHKTVPIDGPSAKFPIVHVNVCGKHVDIRSKPPSGKYTAYPYNGSHNQSSCWAPCVSCSCRAQLYGSCCLRSYQQVVWLWRGWDVFFSLSSAWSPSLMLPSFVCHTMFRTVAMYANCLWRLSDLGLQVLSHSVFLLGPTLLRHLNVRVTKLLRECATTVSASTLASPRYSSQCCVCTFVDVYELFPRGFFFRSHRRGKDSEELSANWETESSLC